MVTFLFLGTLSLLVVLFLKFISHNISESVSLSREELSSYECGFEQHSLSRVPFSLRYFYLTLIFLLFDLEIVLLVIYSPLFFISIPSVTLTTLLLILWVLLFSVIYEWVEGSLDWLN